MQNVGTKQSFGSIRLNGIEQNAARLTHVVVATIFRLGV